MSERIADVKEVWVVEGNTDCTEGKGFPTILAVCDAKATALRIGKGKYVQGSNCPVYKSIAVKLENQGNRWFVPGKIEPVSGVDIKEQERLDAVEAAQEKAKQAGLTDEDIALLKSR